VGDCIIGILCTDKTEISKVDLCYKKNKNNKQNKALSKWIVAHVEKQDYNETALATTVIVPDDGPMWPKHVVLM
jgi:hypothetical protein